MMKPIIEAVSVRLLDREYRMSCAADERDDLIAAANLLHGKMREVRDAQAMSLERIAIMAAINIASDLVQAQKELARGSDHDQQLIELNERLGDELEALNDYRDTHSS